MTYDEFKTAYTNAFNSMQKYTVDKVGSYHYAEKLADLAETHPEFEEKLLNEA